MEKDRSRRTSQPSAAGTGCSIFARGAADFISLAAGRQSHCPLATRDRKRLAWRAGRGGAQLIARAHAIHKWRKCLIVVRHQFRRHRRPLLQVAATATDGERWMSRRARSRSRSASDWVCTTFALAAFADGAIARRKGPCREGGGESGQVAGEARHDRVPVAELFRPIDAGVGIPGIFGGAQLRPAPGRPTKVPDLCASTLAAAWAAAVGAERTRSRALAERGGAVDIVLQIQAFHGMDFHPELLLRREAMSGALSPYCRVDEGDAGGLLALAASGGDGREILGALASPSA